MRPGTPLLAECSRSNAALATIKIDHDEGSAGHAITADPYECMGEWEKRGKVRGEDAVWYGRIMCFMAGAEAESECPTSTPVSQNERLEERRILGSS